MTETQPSNQEKERLMKLLINILFKIKIFKTRLASKNEVETFIKNFVAHYVSTRLIRIGSRNDGGYLVPDILHDLKYCFSPGVDLVSEFEEELSSLYGTKSFMIDASVSRLQINNKDFIFEEKFLSSKTIDRYITLSDWIDKTITDENAKLLLQMDIEGAEYEVLAFENSETLSKFCVIVIEFHDFQNIFDRNQLGIIKGLFEKLYKDFSICHAHPNNNSSEVSLMGISVPKLIEITFIRNDVLENVQSCQNIQLPHVLDEKNVPTKKDLKLSEMWWKTKY